MVAEALPASRERVFELLAQIPDPEIPVVSIEEIGMLRDVLVTDDGYEVILTPTYTGCPAMSIIEADIRAMLAGEGIGPVTVRLAYSPAWTTDCIQESAKEKMRQYGIAPPIHSSCGNLSHAEHLVACPHCSATDTEMISRFGATACKALYKCLRCQEPFEYFKCH